MFDEFAQVLETLNARDISYLVSYDGRTGDKVHERQLPKHLNPHLVELQAGRSSQATLLGRNEVTVESLYLSPALTDRLHIRRRYPRLFGRCGERVADKLCPTSRQPSYDPLRNLMNRECHESDLRSKQAEPSTRSEFQGFKLHGVGGFAVKNVHDGGWIFLDAENVVAVEEHQAQV